MEAAGRKPGEVGAGSPVAPPDVRPRLFYATPTGRHPKPGYVTTMAALRMVQTSFQHGPQDFEFACGPVQMSRSRIAQITLEKNYDAVLMHDDDLQIALVGRAFGCPIDAMWKLMQDDPKVGVVGAVYLRESPLMPTVNMWHPEAKSTKDSPGETVSVVCNLPRQPFECAGVGTGFMLIRPQVFRDVDRLTGGHDPFMFWPYTSQWGGAASIGEDFYFCWRAQQAGWKVLADPRFSTVHDKDSSGRLVYEQYAWDPPDGQPEATHPVQVPEGTKVIKVGGMDCLDVSDLRRVPERKAA